MMLNTDEVNDLWGNIKNHGTGHAIIGLANKVKALNQKVEHLAQDNQDLRNLVCRIRDCALTDQAYVEVQKLIIENREIIKPNDEDVWNIHQRIDMLQRQLSELQNKMQHK